ncbi:hypothetical protein ACIA8K_29440 [Catenuloplanes sp. NPDC051500]|uniref:hypothetical protein n=1 Tax=Catenuloplanes sp. NPDC051500 TaxID=3363959 RepID=UPI003799FD5F
MLAAETAALHRAKSTGQPVRVDARTSETTEVFARPDGQLEATISAGIARVRRGAGWVPLDLTLARTETGAAPGAHPGDLVISGARPAGQHELAASGTGDGRIALGWDGALPEPVLAGATATYPEVLPGVDLVVTATDAAFGESLIVKDRAALERVRRVPLTLTGPGIAGHRTDAAGTLTLTGAGGETLATVPAPSMWDAGTVAGGVHDRIAPIRTTVTARDRGVDLVLEPDAGWLGDASTEFPVTLDPTLNPALTTFDTWVRDKITADQSSTGELQIGLLATTPPTLARSFVSWNTAVLSGKQINSSTVYFYNWWSHTCTATSWEIWTTGAASASTRYTSQPAWSAKEATSTVTKGSTDCADGWATISGASFFQKAATAKQTTAHMGIRATDETVPAGFKQFRSRDWDTDTTRVPYATVTYNAWPTVTARATVPATSCVTGAGRPLVNSLTPQLKATVTDADGTAMSVEFEWWVTGGAAKLGGLTVAGTASGGTATVTVPAGQFIDGGTYSWRVRASDGVANSAVWTSWCEMTTYVTVPPVAGCTPGMDHDYNGDGVRDTAIGDPLATVDGVARAGRVTVTYGGTGTVSVLHQNLEEVPGGAETNDQFGFSLATYDANRDGCSDLAVGAPYEAIGTVAEAGGVVLMLGSPAGLGRGPAGLWYDQGTAGFTETVEAGDWFGYSLAATQTTTGEAALLVGVPGEDIGTGVDAGLVHYRRGTTGVTLYAGAGVPGAAENDDRLGYSLAAAPGFFAIGSPGEAIGTNQFAGAVQTYTHALTSGKPTLLASLDQNAAMDAAEPNDTFGKSVSMAKFAAGPETLLIVGAPGEDVGEVDDAGMVHRFLLSDAGWSNLFADGGQAEGDYFGERVFASASGDGTVMAAVGSPGEDTGGAPDAGRVRVVDWLAPMRTAVVVDRAPVAGELLGLSLGGSPGHLYLGSPYGDGQVRALAWPDLSAGPVWSSPSGAAFGTSIG